MQYLCKPPYLDFIYLSLCVKSMIFKLEQSIVKLLRLKSFFIDKSLRKVVFELWTQKKKLSFIYIRQCLSLFRINEDN